jgi:hypothetical protein
VSVTSRETLSDRRTWATSFDRPMKTREQDREYWGFNRHSALGTAAGQQRCAIRDAEVQRVGEAAHCSRVR